MFLELCKWTQFVSLLIVKIVPFFVVMIYIERL